MSCSINLIDALLSRAKNLQDLGQNHDALSVYKRLAQFKTLSRDLLGQIHFQIGKLHLIREKYKLARRHLTLALLHRPGHGEYHHQMALAIDLDDRVEPQRAGAYYRRALKEMPTSHVCWLDFGVWCFNEAKIRTGLKALFKSFECNTDDPDHLAEIVDILRQQNLDDQATRLLRKALFLHKRDLRFHRMYQRHLFHLSQVEQSKAMTTVRLRDVGPTILAFPRRETKPKLPTGHRYDGPAILEGPHFPVIHKFSQKKRS